MNETKFKEYVKETFENEVPDVLHKIKASPEFRIPDKNPGLRLNQVFKKRITLSFMSAFVVILLAVIVFNRGNTSVAATVTLDINPSFIIELNDEDYVVGLTGYNDDGVQVLEREIEYEGLTLDEFLVILIERLNDLGYIVDSSDVNNIVLIDVTSDNDVIRARVEEKLKTRIELELQKYNNQGFVLDAKDIMLNQELKDQLRQSMMQDGVTYAKRLLVYRINELNSAYTLQELSTKTVRELYNLYISLEDPANLPDYNNMPPARQPNNHTPFDNTNSQPTLF